MTVMKSQCAEFQIPIGLGNTGQRAYSLMYYKLLNPDDYHYHYYHYYYYFVSGRSKWVEFKPCNNSINHNLFLFQTFTFLLAWHFPHKYVVLV